MKATFLFILFSLLSLSSVLSSDFYSENLSHQILIKARVDSADNITVQDGKLWIKHIDWKLPVNISINSRKWDPVWKDNQSDIFSKFDPPLAPFKGSIVSLKLVKGRGETHIVEKPSESNGYKLIIRLQDIGSGASDFCVRVTWKEGQEADEHTTTNDSSDSGLFGH